MENESFRKLYDDGFWNILKDIDLNNLKKITKLNVPKDKEDVTYFKLSQINGEIKLGLKELFILKEIEIDKHTVYLIIIKGYATLGTQRKELRLLDIYDKRWIKELNILNE